MNRLIIFLIVVLIILSGVFILSKKKRDYVVDDNYSDENIVTSYFKDESGKYALHYPADWALEDHSFKNELIRADLFLAEITGIQIRIMDYDGRDQDRYIRGYLNNFEQDMEEHWQGKATNVEKNSNVFSKTNCWKLSLDFISGQDQEWYFIHYLWFRDSDVLVFQSGIMQKYQQLYEQVIDEIARSVVMFD